MKITWEHIRKLMSEDDIQSAIKHYGEINPNTVIATCPDDMYCTEAFYDRGIIIKTEFAPYSLTLI